MVYDTYTIMQYIFFSFQYRCLNEEQFNQEITMKILKNAIATILAVTSAAAVSFSASDVQARSLDEVMSSKKLIVGINPTFPPLGLYNAKNEIDGFDVDVASKLAQMLGV